MQLISHVFRRSIVVIAPLSGLTISVALDMYYMIVQRQVFIWSEP